MKLSKYLSTGSGVVTVAAIWAGLDALVHVRADMVEPPRLAGNIAVWVACAISLVAVRFVGGPKLAAVACGLAAGVVLGFNLAWVVVNGALPVPAAVFFGLALLLLLLAAWRFFGEAAVSNSAAIDASDSSRSTAKRSKLWVGVTAVLFAVAMAGTFVYGFATSIINQLHDDKLIAADYWDDELVVLSAGMGFDNKIGHPSKDFEATIEAGGAWYGEPDCVAPEGPMSSNVLTSSLGAVSRGSVDFDDGLPIVMSWRVLTSTVNPEDFVFTLNDGSQVVPGGTTMTPNWENNERSTIVVFGDFGNRGRAGEPDVLFPVKFEIVDDGTPHTFMGPNGTKSGVGLTWETDTTPYDVGPSLVAAKLNRIGEEAEGEGGVGLLEGSALPNDEFALYGGGDFKVRVVTSGGFSPDGLTGVTPDQFSDFFRLHATGPDGETLLLTETGVDYELEGGTLRVVGMSDLGKPAGDDVHYDDCYAEDADNYIDMILVGDEAAARGLTHIEIPAGDGYLPFYNPGGPGPEPTEGVRYTAPGPPDLEPIINALDNPMRVSYED